MYSVIDLAGNATHEGTVQLLDRFDLVDPHLHLDLTTYDSSVLDSHSDWVSCITDIIELSSCTYAHT